jgi:hypothetical protein
MQSEGRPLPVESDFIDPGSQDLDERHAMKTFLGKTPDEARALFRENFLFYQEELSYMRNPAFRFYVLPAIQYLLSDQSAGDSDAASTFCCLLETRLKDAPDALTPIKPIVLDAIDNILRDFDRFDCSPEFYGDVPARYRVLAERLTA